MSEAFSELLPELEPGEQVQFSRMRVEGERVEIDLAYFAGSGEGKVTTASFAVAGANDVVMKSAVSIAIDEARQAVLAERES